MGNIIRFFNQNKKQIIRVILIILFIIIILQVLNNIAKERQKNSGFIADKSIDYGKDYAIISGEYKDETIYKKETNILNQFANYCNEKNYEQAYNLLTEECKEILYPDIDTFIQGYCNEYFSDKRSCTFQAWDGQTYLVEIREDSMSTGRYSEDKYLQDYYTVKENKLNISSFVKREQINKEKEEKNINVRVLNIDYYIDYTKVTLNVTNNATTKMEIDLKQDPQTLTIEDNNGTKFTSNISEMSISELMVDAGTSRNITLQFQVGYRTDLKIRNITLQKMFVERRGLLEAKVEI